MTKDILTTKITKATKGSDIFDYKLSTTIGRNLRDWRNFQGSKILGFRISSRQGAKAPSSERKDKYSYEFFSPFFPTLAALASLREIFRVSVAVRSAVPFVVKLTFRFLVAAASRYGSW
jgi:hypothetical protein